MRALNRAETTQMVSWIYRVADSIRVLKQTCSRVFVWSLLLKSSCFNSLPVVKMLRSWVFLLMLTSSTLAVPLSLSGRQSPELEAETDRLLFSVSIEEFLAARDAQDPAGLDWSSDGCSSSPDDPFGVSASSWILELLSSLCLSWPLTP
jgi:hypothetical protein